MIAYSQKDPRWSDVRLGTSYSTIGGYGCTLCSVASVLADFGIDVDPGRLNRWLIANGGYTGGNLFIFSAVEPLGVTLVDLIDCTYQPAPVTTILSALAEGMGVVVKVDMSPGGVLNEHWARVTGGDSDDLRIMDPWLPNGFNHYWLLARYGATYQWDLERAIFRVAIYSKGASEGASAFASKVEERSVRGPVQRLWSAIKKGIGS
jgi:hypothetical protein